ncbi:cobW/HypB/UreG, nucleotide-binding domain protein [Mycobacterium intracellulare 1956]|uniref:CobW/HypB/UreG, nucleotide-binding domain protein n=1 Tax=Mycobacterium intracellulare 1956 TaxID=1299331 RepID=X8CBA5_MYCIT|nr:cobW/HypB/UreG, nucleotide-binding domain protein [Mycobacterium intracellulare 1956]
MRTPVILVAGQRDTDAVVGAMLQTPGTLVVEHRFDGHVVRRTTATLSDGVLTSTENGLELAHGCVSCTIRNDLLVLLRRLHRRDDVDRIVVHLAPWLEPEPICLAIKHVRVRVAPGYIDGPAALDVAIAAVVTCVDSAAWLDQALGEEELDDGRTHAQVVIGQAEFADVVVLDRANPFVAAVLRRLSPRARVRAWGRRHRGRTEQPVPRRAPRPKRRPARPAAGRAAAAGVPRSDQPGGIQRKSPLSSAAPARRPGSVARRGDQDPGTAVAGQQSRPRDVAGIGRPRAAGELGRQMAGGDERAGARRRRRRATRAGRARLGRPAR